MGKKLYVGNLPFSIGSEDLQELFQSHGTVESAQVITDRDSGRSKGFGFVEMSNDDEAQMAIKALNGAEVDGRTLTVNEAKPRPEGGRGEREGGFRGGRPGGGFGGGRRSGPGGPGGNRRF